MSELKWLPFITYYQVFPWLCKLLLLWWKHNWLFQRKSKPTSGWWIRGKFQPLLPLYILKFSATFIMENTRRRIPEGAHAYLSYTVPWASLTKIAKLFPWEIKSWLHYKGDPPCQLSQGKTVGACVSTDGWAKGSTFFSYKHSCEVTHLGGWHSFLGQFSYV